MKTVILKVEVPDEYEINGIDCVPLNDDLLDKRIYKFTEIQLPTDEEIAKGIIKDIVYVWQSDAIKGAKWLRDRILNTTKQ